MANQIPIKVMCDGSGNTCGLAQFTSSDSVAIAAGGTGLTSQGICEFVQPGLYAVGCQVTYLGICAGKADTGAGHNNTYVGHSAGTAVTTGCNHTIIGSQAGKAITTCNATVAIGYSAGCAITGGMYNTLIGTDAGAAIVTANGNTAIGYSAAKATICSNNTAIGRNAMLANTQGQYNTAIGDNAGASMVAAGCNNTFVGFKAGCVVTCRDNTLIGADAGRAATSGGGNTMIGACVGYGVVGGASNVYIGDKAGLANTGGNANVFIGNCAGCASTASCCLIIGNGTCDLITGNFNTGIVSLDCVGIGTASPSKVLHIWGDDNSNPVGQLIQQNGTDDATLQMHVMGGSGGGNYSMRVGGSGGDIGTCNWGIYDEDNSAVRLVIADGGEVGIGTTAPTAKAEIAFDSGGFDTTSVATMIASSSLAFEGNNDMRIIFEQDGSTFRGMMGYAHAGSTYIGIWDNGSSTTPSLVSQGGEIGIGTTAPGSTLEVATGATQKVAEFWGTDATSFVVVSSDAETQNNQSGIAFNATKGNIIGSANSVAGVAGKVTNSSGALTGDMIFSVNGGDDFGEKMRLTSGGSLGIGTTAVGGSPGAGSVEFQKDGNNYVRFWDNATATLYMQANGVNAPTIAMKNSDSDSLDITSFQRTNAGGNLFGQSRNGLMQVSGAPQGSFAVGTSNATNLVLGTNNTAAVTIDSSQNVGIGQAPVSPGDSGSSQVAVAINNELILGCLATTNGAISTADSLWINVDSNNNQSGAGINFAHNGYGTSGTILMAIKDTGLVGIGTTAPDSLLHLETAAVDTAKLQIESTATNGYPTLTFKNDATTWNVYGANGGNGSSADAFQIENASGAYFLIQTGGNVGIGTTNPGKKLHVYETTANPNLDLHNTNGSLAEPIIRAYSDRSANGAYSFLKGYSGSGFADTEFNLTGEGNGYADGSWYSSGADYQEFFESTDGATLEVGKSVVMDGDKVRVYNASSDSTDNIIGVVRPKADNKNSAMIGNTAWNHWTDKYLTDDWGVYLREDVTVWTYTEDGQETAVYERDQAEDWTPPEDAVSSLQSVRKLNPEYSVEVDDETNYTPREDRDEWNLIGLLGQVQIKANEPTRPTWIKMKNISDAVELWLIR